LRRADLTTWDSTKHVWVPVPGPAELLISSSAADADVKLRLLLPARP